MNREEAIKYIKSRCIGSAEERDGTQWSDAMWTAIEALSKPKTGWISVSEKPKDEKRTYLVQLDGGGMCSCRWTNANPFWTDLTTEWHWNIFDIPQYSKVVAWMDLEPYREDGEA